MSKKVENSEPGPTKTETLMGGIAMPAEFLDGRNELVTVRQLPIEDMPALLVAMDSEPAMVEVYTGKPKGWSKGMKPDSFEAIFAEGERLNADFFVRWVNRQMARQEKLIPGITDQVKKKALSLSQTPSPNSPSSAA